MIEVAAVFPVRRVALPKGNDCLEQFLFKFGFEGMDDARFRH
jgi:hypothetical protein